MAEGVNKATLFFFLAIFAVSIPCLQANIADEYDEYIIKRSEEARRAALEAYEPEPYNVTSEFNLHVHLALKESNRRGLRRSQYAGPCMATNPIDRCWRCRRDWATDRMRLATCVKGFGRKTTGGLGGRIYVVNDPSDSDLQNPKPGTLRYGAIQDEPLWIIFERDMTIVLQQELLVNSHKTIDGRGANVQITKGASISLFMVTNVIIHNIRIHDVVPKPGGLIRDSVQHVGMRTRSDGDAISIFGSSNIWIDHISMSKAADGLVDVIQGSTGVTISNCHMTNHNDVMLLGASDVYSGDKIMQVTVAFNHFGQGLIQRMPRARWGFVHVVNNDYTHWIMYAIGGSSGPTILSQGNRFIAPNDHAAKEVTHREYATQQQWSSWRWTSEMDLLVNGATFLQSGGQIVTQSYGKDAMIKPRDGAFVTRLTRFSGALGCRVGKPC
ncbi:pectate lyase-like [Neltuma alba]|uniref:pectate lyase-like n=1 Tax=Neltuma alba TaxID=207710 RepID=UPI0010A40B7E|nr:pectate lyase-like [Prosopis alba]